MNQIFNQGIFMLAIISPAKTLDFETPAPNFPFANSQSKLTAYSQQLVDICKQFSPAELGSLMSISDKLASLNVARFAEWQVEHNEKMLKRLYLRLKAMFIPGWMRKRLLKHK